MWSPFTFFCGFALGVSMNLDLTDTLAWLNLMQDHVNEILALLKRERFIAPILGPFAYWYTSPRSGFCSFILQETPWINFSKWFPSTFPFIESFSSESLQPSLKLHRWDSSLCWEPEVKFLACIASTALCGTCSICSSRSMLLLLLSESSVTVKITDLFSS